uniref:NADH-ubiquinone oxidoreductase chain 4L n=1 Tax=Gramastacus insolitus TaxID=99772 RepID=A0A191TEE3_9EUCA|nr:NADH dehydrogenase subunit 4L [Gramastacus insolitus]ANI86979.1 NADH dehydrogenase subunit 4L [Gramastacus insolitus]
MLSLSFSSFVFFVMAMSGFSVFIFSYKHLLNVLLGLEFIMLSIFGSLSMVMSGVSLEVYFVMFFLIMAACEGALGLSLLVSIVRSHGNDYFSSFGVLSC